MSLQMILGGGEDARPLIEVAHEKGMRTVVVDLPENLKVGGLTDLVCYVNPLDEEAVLIMARQLGVADIIASPKSRASSVEAKLAHAFLMDIVPTITPKVPKPTACIGLPIIFNSMLACSSTL